MKTVFSALGVSVALVSGAVAQTYYEPGTHGGSVQGGSVYGGYATGTNPNGTQVDRYTHSHRTPLMPQHRSKPASATSNNWFTHWNVWSTQWSGNPPPGAYGTRSPRASAISRPASLASGTTSPKSRSASTM